MSNGSDAERRRLLADAAEEIAVLARCLRVESNLEQWAVNSDSTAGAVAADALDQAIGLLDELAAGRASDLSIAARRVAANLPPPLE